MWLTGEKYDWLATWSRLEKAKWLIDDLSQYDWQRRRLATSVPEFSGILHVSWCKVNVNPSSEWKHWSTCGRGITSCDCHRPAVKRDYRVLTEKNIECNWTWSSNENSRTRCVGDHNKGRTTVVLVTCNAWKTAEEQNRQCTGFLMRTETEVDMARQSREILTWRIRRCLSQGNGKKSVEKYTFWYASRWID